MQPGIVFCKKKARVADGQADAVTCCALIWAVCRNQLAVRTGESGEGTATPSQRVLTVLTIDLFAHPAEFKS
jgi:hypothetical protein